MSRPLRTLVGRIRAATGPHRQFLDWNHDLERTILIGGSGRSGSTWLAEVISRACRFRLMFEPFDPNRNPAAVQFSYGMVLSEATATPAHIASARHILEGRSRSEWADRYNQERWPRGRVIKEIRITGLLPWLATTFPDIAVVHLVRNPVDVAKSMSRLGWTDMTEPLLGAPGLAATLPLSPGDVRRLSAEPFDQQVVRWCIENHLVLTKPLPGRSASVFYEHIVEEPVDAFSRLGRFLGPAFDVDVAIRTADRRSATTWRTESPYDGGSGAPLPSQPWDRAAPILEAFGLGGLYGPDGRPIRPAGEQPSS